MPRKRYIKHEFFRNETLSELDPLTRLLFIGLWTLADRRGRLEDRPKRIKADLFPYENIDVDDRLSALMGAGFIIRYGAEGQRVIQINNFEKHQQCHINEGESLLPPPPVTPPPTPAVPPSEVPPADENGPTPEQHPTSTVLEPCENGASKPFTLTLTNTLTSTLTQTQTLSKSGSAENEFSDAAPNFDPDDEFELVEILEVEGEATGARIIPLEAEKKEKDPPVPAAPPSLEKPPPLVHRMCSVFEDEHRRHFSPDGQWTGFDWTGKEFAALKALGKRLEKRYREHNRTDTATDEQVLSTWRAFLQKTADSDPWYLENCFTPSGLSCHYQKIVNKLTHANANHTGRSAADEALNRAFDATMAYLDAQRATRSPGYHAGTG